MASYFAGLFFGIKAVTNFSAGLSLFIENFLLGHDWQKKAANVVLNKLSSQHTQSVAL